MGNSSSSVKEFNPKSSLNIDKQKYFKWKYDTLVDERNQLRDTAHRFFKVYKELEEPDWSERVKGKQLRAILREEQLRMQSVLRKSYQEAQVLAKNMETQESNINLKRRMLRDMYEEEKELIKVISNIGQKINTEKTLISNKYGLIKRHRKAVILGRVLTILTLATILYFVIGKLNS